MKINVWNELTPIAPHRKDNGDVALIPQDMHCHEEAYEATSAMLEYLDNPTNKRRAHWLEEEIDELTCRLTKLTAVFTDEEIALGIQLVNTKCKLRKYDKETPYERETR